MAHTFDTNLRFSGVTNPLTANYTCGNDATLLVLGIVVGTDDFRSGGAPTYGGVEFSLADKARGFSPGFFDDPRINKETTCELWYLLIPETGSAIEISIPNPPSFPLHVQASSYNTAAGKTSVLDVDSGSEGKTASPSVSVTPTVNGAVIVGVLGSGEDFIPTANSGTELNTTDNGLYSDSNQFTLQASAGAIATSWTTQTYGAGVYGGGIYNGDDSWAMVVAAFKEVSVPVIVTPDAFALTMTLIPPAIKIDGSIDILPVAVAITATIIAPTVSSSLTHEPSALSLTATLAAPSLRIDGTVSPSAVPIVASVQNVSITIQQNVTVIISALALTGTVEQPNVLAPLPVVRMMPFIFSATVAYMMEFGDKYARFYFAGQPLLGSGETHVELDTPYSPTELYQLQTRQIADVMWSVHSNHPQAQLKRTGVSTFVLENIEFTKGPFLERNDIAEDDGVTMNVDVTGAGLPGTLTRSSGVFEEGHVGALFKLTHPRVNRQTNGKKIDSETGIIGEVIDVFGTFIFSVTSTGFVGTVRLQRSTDDFITSDDVAGGVFTSGPQTFESTEETEGARYRINVTAHSSGTIAASLAVNTSSVNGTATAIGVIGVPLDIKGAFNFNTHGNWDGTVALERNDNDAGWEPSRTFVSVIENNVGDRNVQLSAIEEDDNIRYRINVTAYNSGTIRADLEATSSTQSGIVRINGINSSTEASITVVSKVSQTTTTIRWAEGAWSGVRGFPAAVGLFEERVIYGGTVNNPNRIWLSEIGRFNNFEAGINDSDSFQLDLPSTNIVRWIAALEALIIGHGGEEFRIRSSQLDQALTPTDFSIRQQSSHGSSALQAPEVGSVLLFIDSVGRKVREFVFSDAEQKFLAPDLTALAENITTSGIVNFAYQKNPDSLLWCVLDNGDLLSLSYEREQNVVAWALHPMDGLVQSVAVIPAAKEDEVWISVVRSIDGDTKVYIEQFQSRFLDIRKENSYFIDSGIIYRSILTSTIAGLDHLEGRTVSILADGEVVENQRVSGGQITLSTPARNVRVGLPYTSKAIPMRLDLNLPDGTTLGSIKRIAEVALSVHDTLNLKYGASDTELFDIDWEDARWKNTSKIEGLFTGIVIVATDGGFDVEDDLVLSQSDPLPCTVRAIVPRVEKVGR